CTGVAPCRSSTPTSRGPPRSSRAPRSSKPAAGAPTRRRTPWRAPTPPPTSTASSSPRPPCRAGDRCARPRTTMLLLTVFTHQSPDRYPAALIDSFHAPLSQSGVTIDILDLHRERFDPRFTAEDHAHFWGGPIPPDIEEMHRR